jgi:N,N'-diacetyllegionaminate synthase
VKTFIIAEAGVNHNGSIKIARKLIDIAAEAGADAVKFQTFKAGKLVNIGTQKAEYQKIITDKKESQFDMLKKLELRPAAHRELLKYCKKKKIIFLSTPFDLESIDLLNHLMLKIFKIPSGEITNLPYLRKVGSLGKKIFMSTGMANMDEIEDALNILMDAGTKKADITVLHCNTEYPTPYKDVNLRAMLTIKEVFKVNIGYSDHTLGIEVPIAAVALGATVIEKHFTLDKNMEGPDHKASLEPRELKCMVKAIRNIEKALGHSVKRPSASEFKNIPIARKSIVAAKNIVKGETFSERNITVKRPGTGISPMQWDKILGKRAIKNFKKDELIEI